MITYSLQLKFRLACVGFVVQQYFHIVSPEADPLKAVTALGYGPNLQILFAIGCIELATWDQTFTSTTPGMCID